MRPGFMGIPAAAAAAAFLLAALEAASADLYTDEYVINETKEDIVKLKKLLPSKSANGVTLMDVTYTEPEKGAEGNGTITYVQRFDSIRKKDIPDLEKFGRDVQDSMWHISEQICENEGTRMRIDHGIELRYKYVSLDGEDMMTVKAADRSTCEDLDKIRDKKQSNFELKE
ncbi:MAG: hypothetical protein MR757_08910 [Proteobacteria bacterium]|nr:hypothetical protein [Pseudomonadota bacterium]